MGGNKRQKQCGNVTEKEWASQGSSGKWHERHTGNRKLRISLTNLIIGVTITLVVAGLSIGAARSKTKQRRVVVFKVDRYVCFLSVVFCAILVWSAIGPKDYFTWMLEVAPGVAGFIVLAVTYQRFRFTNFVYTLILLHCAVLFVGGHYTYAEVPLFDWIRDFAGGTRNNYDKVGHFAQGFVPALIGRELLLRLQVVKNRSWTNFFVISIALAISAIYELIEWWTAVLTGEASDAFLGTQGYVWDTQSDMLWALIGALTAITLFSAYQDGRMTGLSAGMAVARPSWARNDKG